MRLILISSLLFLTACSANTVLVNRSFPDIPPSLEKLCDNLDQVPETDKLSVVLKTVTTNYKKYHECSLQVDLWNEWYSNQKKVFNAVQ